VRTMCSTKCARVAGKGRVFSRAARNGAFARGVSFRGGMERRGSLPEAKTLGMAMGTRNPKPDG
jgi:hypothetical protein